VESEDIEMGFEVRQGRYVTFDKRELEELKPESTKAVEVTDFVELEAIDPIYYERTYWLAPGNGGEKAYQLLLAAMEERGRAAIGSVVMRNKQYLAAIRPLDTVLAMSTMRFADEVVPRKDVDELPSRRSKPEAKALRMATQLVDSLASEWDPRQYHDTYTEELRQRIADKQAGKELTVASEKEPTAKVVDLMEALAASVESAKGSRRSPRRSSRQRRRTSTPRAAKSAKKSSKSTGRSRKSA
jgi:DNA end-binding protein Ku